MAAGDHVDGYAEDLNQQKIHLLGGLEAVVAAWCSDASHLTAH